MEGSLNLITDGLRLAAVGMGTVFLFLSLLVWATAVMSALVRRFLPLPVDNDVSYPDGVTERERLVAIITAAVHAHKSNQTKS